MMPVDVAVCPNEGASWDAIWKWSWFQRETWAPQYWKESRKAVKPLISLLSGLDVRSVLDGSCGLGFKTVLLSREGYDVEGSDASAVAILHAPEIAKEEGLEIRFFRSRYGELGRRCGRMYDCVYSDAFDWIGEREEMLTAAKGIKDVLSSGGKFVFDGVPRSWTERDLAKSLGEDWSSRKPFVLKPACERGGRVVTEIEHARRVPGGIAERRIYFIEKGGSLRVEVAEMANRIKWTWRDYERVLRKAGFSYAEPVESGGKTYVVATI